jgi:hypothetical protein
MQRVAFTILVATLLSATAHADLKLVQKTVMEGELSKQVQKAGGPSQPPSVTMFYKGNKTRTEAGDRVTIFDGERVLLLNPAKKTYQAIPKNAASDMASANPMMAMMDIKASVDVKATGKTQSIQGKQAKQYVMTMTMKLGMKQGAGGGEKGEAPQLPAFTTRTELWTADFPGVTLSPSMAKQSMPGGMGSMPFVKDMTEKLKTIKGIPLLTTMNQEIMGKKMNMSIKTVSLSEAPLPDSLFAPPAGYKQVPYTAPAMPMMPGGG